jgi:uncharacterized membrane protein
VGAGSAAPAGGPGRLPAALAGIPPVRRSLAAVLEDRMTTAPDRAQAAWAGRTILAGLLLGTGFVAFVDEVVFHQLLGWHHFYDRSTDEVGLISDGLFHAFSWFATVAGLFTGIGAFQLYDGTVQHKLLGLHQIRYEMDLLPYDLIWNVVAAVLLATGLVLTVVTGRAARRAGSRGGGPTTR